MKKIPLIILAVLFLAATAFGYTGLNYQQPLTYSYSPKVTTSTTTTYTILYSDDYVQCNATGGSYTLTLPTISSLHSSGYGSKSYKIIKTDSSTNTCTIAAGSGDTIGGESARVLTQEDAYIVISAQAADWIVAYETPYIVENHATGSVDLQALPTYEVGITLDDGSGDTPSLTFTDGSDEDAVFTKSDGAFLGLTTVAADGLNILTGNLKVGNGTPGVAQNGEDFYVEGTAEVDGAAQFDGAVTTNSTITAAGNVTLDDNSGASPSLTLTDETNETAIFSKVDSGFLTVTTAAADGVQVTTGNLKVGNGTPGVAQDGEDAYVEGTFEVDGASQFDGAITANSTIAGAGNVTLDDGSGASPSITLQDETNETAVISKADAGNTSVTTDASDGLQVLTGNLFVGNGTPDETINGEDMYCEGISEFDGTMNLDGDLTVGDAVTDGITLTAAIQGASPIILDGATDNTNELTIAVADPGADYTLTIPASSNASVMISSLTTNDVAAANGVWGASNGLVMEGASADDFELTITPTDPTADRTVTIPDSTGTVLMQTGTGSYWGYEDLTGADTLTTADCGKLITLNSASEFQTTLPAATAGCFFRFAVKAAPSGASYTIVTNGSANVIHGQIASAEDAAGSVSTTAQSDTISFVDGKAIIGDYVEVISDGTNWYVSGMCNVQDGITTTQVS